MRLKKEKSLWPPGNSLKIKWKKAMIQSKIWND
jgi:hypothetical protein